MKTRILLNGKKAALDFVRSGIFAAREKLETSIEVRPTWESGDIERLVAESIQENVDRIIAGGGDGTVNEVVNALIQYEPAQRPDLAILPLGTANDFATGCGIPSDVEQSIILAAQAKPAAIDIVRVNDMHFINVASAGFGAHVTATTPVELKNFLGGKAYTLAGLIKALNFKPYPGKAVYDDGELEGAMYVGAVCNGRQAGGGQILAPEALINDGLMDVMVIMDFPVSQTGLVLQELQGVADTDAYVKRFRCKQLEYFGEEVVPVNLDGEPYNHRRLKFEVLPKAINLIVPDGCTLLD